MGEEFGIVKGYPIVDVLPGWFFRIEEIANGAYRGEGKDLIGREVACSGSDRDEVIEKLKSYAVAISN
jgi:hypothetical protein